MNKRLELAVLGIALALGGCSTQPVPWQRPPADIPATWSDGVGKAIENPQEWWKNFQDPQLHTLVERALVTNNDFAAATIRVRQMQLQADLTDTNRTPSVAVNAAAGSTRSFHPPATVHFSGLAASTSYEVDLWGKLKSQRDQGRWEAEATAADCRAFGGMLVGTVAKHYWQLAYLNQVLAMTDADIEYAQRTLDLVRAKFAAGAVSGLNIAQAELNLSTQQATRTQLVQQRAESRNALAILFDQPPRAVGAERLSLPEGPLPVVGPGLPADVLSHRPDLQAAELRLREALAGTDIARTSFYPTLSLTGSLGTASTSLVNFVQNPIAAVGAGLALPFVQWNTAKLTTQISQAQYDEAVVLFRQRLYTALAEVENALSARTQLQDEENTLRSSVAQAQSAESISRTRFEAGATEVQLWLDAQARERGVERLLLANRLNQFDNQADLYRILGLGIAPDRATCGLKIPDQAAIGARKKG